MSLKVLMMGGLRCGKTSALAGMLAQLSTNTISRYLTVVDKTVLEADRSALQATLRNKILELEEILKTRKEDGRQFLLDRNPSYCFKTHKFRFMNPRTWHGLDIDFLDSVGTYFSGYLSAHSEEIKERVKNSDVFIVAVDTPYLMGSTEEDTKDICPESINLGVNCVDELQRLLTYIDDNDGKGAKMVLFVPIKCEKWAKEPEGLDKVTSRIKEVYATHIMNLLSLKRVAVAIIPIQTSGNILFSEFRKPYVHESIYGRVRCCKIDDEIIRKEDGKLYILKEEEKLYEDDGGTLYSTSIRKPFSWFRVNPLDRSYSPVNCDQLAFHILRFILQAYMDAERSGFTRWFSILPPVNRYKKWLGEWDLQELRDIMQRLQYDGVIKDHGEGIEIIKHI